MNLYAISDLHLSHPANVTAITGLEPKPDDWLVLAGDVGETAEHMQLALSVLTPKFRQLVWVPGNHELWTQPSSAQSAPTKYLELLKICANYGVLTPEDPYRVHAFEAGAYRIAPVFTLYDYSFAPNGMTAADARSWAREAKIDCADEYFLNPHPFADVAAWCHDLCVRAERRLAEESPDQPTVLITHFPLRRDLVWLPTIPRFVIWCGTTRTECWHRRFNVRVAISGHLHLNSTRFREGTRFEEVSLGYPKQWLQRRDPDRILRRIL